MGYDISISILNIEIWIQYLDISYFAISHDMGYDITMYHDISFYITPDYPETTGKQIRNLVAVSSLFWLSVSALFLVCLSFVLPFFVVLLLSISGTHHRTDRTTSKKNSNLVPSGPSLLPERMHVFVLFIFLFFPLHLFPCLFRRLGTLISYLLTRHLVYFGNST